MWKKMKLFPKTFCYMLFLFAVVIAVMHSSIYVFVSSFYLKQVERDLNEKLNDLGTTLCVVEQTDYSEILENFAVHNAVNITAEMDGRTEQYRGTSGWVMETADGDVRVDFEDAEDRKAIVWDEIEVRAKDGRQIKLQMMMSTQLAREAVNLTMRLLPFTSVLAILLSVVFSYFYSRKLTKPVRQMLEVTNGMKNLEQDAYFEVREEDEIGILLKQINEIYGQLWQTIDSLEKEKAHISEVERTKVVFLRAASHELKTPLAGLRILLENMRLGIGKYKDHDTYLEEGIQTVDALTEMIKEILDSSRIQGEAGEAKKSTLLVEDEIAQVLKDYEILAKARALEIEMEIAEGLSVEMNSGFFRRVWSNLIGNAVKYSDHGGTIKIKGNQEELSIWNPCTPLLEEQTAHIFEAFYRPDFARSADAGGSGLGLYIVKEILEANGLSCQFAPEGAGMRFSMTLR